MKISSKKKNKLELKTSAISLPFLEIYFILFYFTLRLKRFLQSSIDSTTDQFLHHFFYLEFHLRHSRDGADFIIFKISLSFSHTYSPCYPYFWRVSINEVRNIKLRILSSFLFHNYNVSWYFVHKNKIFINKIFSNFSFPSINISTNKFLYLW